jgi:hypothetical protein
MKSEKEARANDLISRVREINRGTIFTCPIQETYVVRGLAALGESAVLPIIKEIRSSNAKRRGILLIALAGTGSPQAIPMLLRSTCDRDESNCRLAASLLKGFAPRRVGDLESLNDAIGRTKSKEAYDALKGVRRFWNESLYGARKRTVHRLKVPRASLGGEHRRQGQVRAAGARA